MYVDGQPCSRTDTGFVLRIFREKEGVNKFDKNNFDLINFYTDRFFKLFGPIPSILKVIEKK